LLIDCFEFFRISRSGALKSKREGEQRDRKESDGFAKKLI
jgi:hypothetical protein